MDFLRSERHGPDAGASAGRAASCVDHEFSVDRVHQTWVTSGIATGSSSVVELFAQCHHRGCSDRFGFFGDVGFGSVLVAVGDGDVAFPARIQNEAFDQTVFVIRLGRGDAGVGIAEASGRQARADERFVLRALDRAGGTDIRYRQHLATAVHHAGDFGDLP